MELCYDGKPPERCKRVRITYRGDNLYFIMVYDDNGQVKQITLEQSSPEHNSAETQSGLEAMAQLASAMLKIGAIDELMEIMKKSSLGARTLPGIIYTQLKEYKTPS